MARKKIYLYYWVFIVIALISAIAVYSGVSKILSNEKIERKARLQKANEVAATELDGVLLNYVTLLSGIKSYIEVEQQVPSKEQIRGFIDFQLEDLEIDSPFSLTYVDTNHIIVYDLVFHETDDITIEGKTMRSIIGKTGVRRMDSLMRSNSFYASNPTNLLEGEVGLPLGFGVLDNNGEPKGYVTSVALFKPIVDRVYNIIDKDEYVLSFTSGNNNHFDRTRSYNKQKVYAKNEDPEYFKNFNVPEEDYVYSKVSFYNNTFTVGTALKKKESQSAFIWVLSSLWYLALLGFMLFIITRFYIYKRKNTIIATQKQQLIELVATKNKFFNIVAHDLRSPLASVLSFLDILRTEGTSTETNKKILEALGDSSKNSLTLLDNLLKWSKIQTGKIQFHKEAIDLFKIASDQIRVQHQEATIKKLRVDLECSFKEKVPGDKNLIANVIRNLLSNAIKYSYEEGVIVVEISKKNNEVSVSIEDNGVGIPKEYLTKLFDVTEVTTQKGTKNEKGSGLGLVLSKQFIEMHGGKLQIESRESKGTLVTFTLPLEA